MFYCSLSTCGHEANNVSETVASEKEFDGIKTGLKSCRLHSVSAMKLERWLTMSRQRSSSNPPLRALRRYISLGWTSDQIPLQRGQPAVLYKPQWNFWKEINFNSRRAAQRALYWHTAWAADTIWYAAGWAFTPATVPSVDLFPTENKNRGHRCKQPHLGQAQGLVVKKQTGTVDTCHPLQGVDLT